MSDHLKNYKDKAQIAQLAARKVKELSKDSHWHILQQITQEIESIFIAEDQSAPTHTEMRKLLEKEVTLRFQDDKEVLGILVEGIPSGYTIGKWRKKEGWNEAVWDKIKNDGLFTKERRAQVINTLYKKATDVKRPDVQAAKLWLTMSGDYSDKLDIGQDKTMEQYKEINAILHRNKSN